MLLVLVVLVLGGLAIMFSGIENQSLLGYIQTWVK